jgi:CBS domain containing-hemolysin-like protein
MESIAVRDIMVPLENYATVSEDATLAEAVLALEQAQKDFDQNKYRHRAILVYGKRGKIVGKLSQPDILKALEPKYEGVKDFRELDDQFGIDADHIRKLIDDLGLLKNPAQDICRKAAECKVKSIMHEPSKGEYVEETATLNEAIVQLLMGHHQSLLVTRGKEIVGILRLTDVFAKVTDMIKACGIKS